jgi:RES domain-containing protein
MPAMSTSRIDRRDTHRLIPVQFADGGASVLARLTDDDETLAEILELDGATNDRLLAEWELLPGIDPRELIFGIPSYRIINAAFCHPAPGGSRFNSSDRGAWYAAFEVETSQAEVAYHRRIWLRETGWDEEDAADYIDYLADFRAEFHDMRHAKGRGEWLSPKSYVASQALAPQLLERGSAGIVYPSVRRAGGTCIACFRPVLATNVRKGEKYEMKFTDLKSAPRFRRIKSK